MKTYYSIGRSYAATVLINGTPRLIRFRDLGQLRNRGVFSTNSEEIAEALEKHPSFGFSFYLYEGEIKKEEVKVEEHVYDAVYLSKRTQDAIKILVEKHGIDRDTIKKRQDVLDKAVELNISFPNL